MYRAVGNMNKHEQGKNTRMCLFLNLPVPDATKQAKLLSSAL